MDRPARGAVCARIARRRTRPFSPPWLLALAGILACDSSPQGDRDTGDRDVVVALTVDAEGLLQYCDADGVCQTAPNPDACAELIIETNIKDGNSCLTCRGADGGTG